VHRTTDHGQGNLNIFSCLPSVTL